eukprot:403349327
MPTIQQTFLECFLELRLAIEKPKIVKFPIKLAAQWIPRKINEQTIKVRAQVSVHSALVLLRIPPKEPLLICTARAITAIVPRKTEILLRTNADINPHRFGLL